MKRDAGYELTCAITAKAVKAITHYPGPKPLFALPAKGIAVIASLADVGHRIARNTEAVALVDFLCAECRRRGLPDVPTVMMLAISLEAAGLPIERVPLSELGLKVGTT